VGDKYIQIICGVYFEKILEAVVYLSLAILFFFDFFDFLIFLSNSFSK